MSKKTPKKPQKPADKAKAKGNKKQDDRELSADELDGVAGGALVDYSPTGGRTLDEQRNK